MRRCYRTTKFTAKTLDVLHLADDIITDYQTQGYELTLRQLYYQFVARDLIPNTAQSYNKLGTIVNKGRLAGMLDWASIVDRTRKCEIMSTWDSAAEILQSAEDTFKLNKWNAQPTQVEVWVEKEALAQVVQRAADEFDMPWFCCRGYPSQSSIYEAAQRHIRYGKPVIVLHLGDHDPSGIDMTRDLQDRLHMFEADTQVKRIALNMGQVDAYNPPPNPAKITDSRAAMYIARFGAESWELDALDPSVLHALIMEEASQHIDSTLWARVVDLQEAQRDVICRAKEEIQ